MNKQQIIDEIKYNLKRSELLLNKLISDPFAEISDLFENTEVDIRNFYPTATINEFFDFKYQKRKLGVELVKKGFIRSTATVNGKNTNGYYLKIKNTQDWAKMNDIKSKFNNV